MEITVYTQRGIAKRCPAAITSLPLLNHAIAVVEHNLSEITMHDSFEYPAAQQLPLGIVLHRVEDDLITVPLDNNGFVDSSVPSFELPDLPAQLLQDLFAVGRTFWRLERCAMSFLLLIDINTKTWSSIIPPQRCSSAWVRHAVSADSLSSLPETYRISGSVVIGVESPAFEQANCTLPGFDGVHVVVDLSDGWGTVRFFERTVGDAMPVFPRWVPVPERVRFLREHAGLMTVVE